MLIPGVSSTGFPSNANFGSYLLYLLLPSSFFFVRLTSSALKLLKNVSVFFFFLFFLYLKVTDLLLKQAAVFVPLFFCGKISLLQAVLTNRLWSWRARRRAHLYSYQLEPLDKYY